MAFRQWLTPRFPLEMALASAVTLGLVFAFLAERQPARLASPMVATAVPQPVSFGPDPRDRMSRFMEQNALAHVGPLRSEAELAQDDAPVPAPPAVEVVNRNLDARVQNRLVTAGAPRPEAQSTAAPVKVEAGPPKSVLGPIRPPQSIPPRGQDVAFNAPEPPRLESKSKPQSGFHIPVVSDLTAKLPSGQEIADGVSNVGKKITSIFR